MWIILEIVTATTNKYQTEFQQGNKKKREKGKKIREKPGKNPEFAKQKFDVE